MCHKINKKRVGACIAAVVVALASLLCSLQTAAATLDETPAQVWGVDAFPYAFGESTLADIAEVDVFVGLEFLREGWGSSVAANPMKHLWYNHFEGAVYSYYSYPQVFVRENGAWIDISNCTLIDSTSEYGVNFLFGAYDGETNVATYSDEMGNSVTYADYFQKALTGEYDGKHCLVSEHVFAVRWTAKIGANGDTDKFVYFGFPVSSAHVTDDNVMIEKLQVGWYLEHRTHPAQAAYWSAEEVVEEYEGVISDLESELEAAESERDAAIAGRENLWEQAYDEGYAQGEYIGFDNGYRVGLEQGSDVDVDYIIDDTSVQSTVISFIAVCFRGVRDFFNPFFEIEFFGFKVFDMMAVSVVGGLIVGVVFFALKFVRG